MSKWGPLTAKFGSGQLNKVSDQSSWAEDLQKSADDIPRITIGNAVQLLNQRHSVAAEKKAGKQATAKH